MTERDSATEVILEHKNKKRKMGIPQLIALKPRTAATCFCCRRPAPWILRGRRIVPQYSCQAYSCPLGCCSPTGSASRILFDRKMTDRKMALVRGPFGYISDNGALVCNYTGHGGLSENCRRIALGHLGQLACQWHHCTLRHHLPSVTPQSLPRRVGSFNIVAASAIIREAPLCHRAVLPSAYWLSWR